jgi:hypothetical protein
VFWGRFSVLCKLNSVEVILVSGWHVKISEFKDVEFFLQLNVSLNFIIFHSEFLSYQFIE